MKPTRLMARANSVNSIEGSASMSRAEIYARFELADAPKHGVFWNGHEFEVMGWVISSSHTEGYDWEFEPGFDEAGEAGHTTEFHMWLYYPIDPRTTRKDWEGATRAYANETNTGWLPAHADADHMHDREVELRAGIVAVFQPQLDNLLQAVLTATDNKPRDWPIGTPWETRQTRRLRFQKLIEFRDAAITCAITEARERHIGWYHQHPEESHLHHLVHDCITTTLAKAGDAYTVVYGEIRAAAVSLALHPYETRWDRAARLKAEAAKAAAAAQDQEASDAADGGASE